MPKETKKHHPPKHLQGVLWSADVADLDLEENKAYIIHQILMFGTFEEILWLLKTYPKAIIQKVFIERPMQVYTTPTFHFIKDFVLGLDKQNLPESRYVNSFY